MAKPQTNEGRIGHNHIPGNRLKAFIERVERVEEEKRGLGEDIKEIYGEVKATGFEPKIVKKIVKLRRASKEKLREEKELTELYLSAMGENELADAFA